MFKKNSKYEVLTPTGWSDFKGIMEKGFQPVIQITLQSGQTIKSTFEHKFYENNVEKKCSDFKLNDLIDTNCGPQKIISIDYLQPETVYDLVEVDHNHKFIANECFTTRNCDEFAFLRTPSLSQAFWTSVQPTLSTGGSCIITSTPKSDADQFAQIWHGAIDTTDEYGNENESGVGKNGFYAMKVPWWEHPERDEEWAKPFRESLGKARFSQEFECDFISDDETLINPLTLTRLRGKEPEFFTGRVRWYHSPEPNKAYLIGLDPSLGTGGDNAAIQVFQLPEMKQIAEWQHNLTTTRGQIRILMQILHFIDSTLRDDPEQHSEPEIFWTVENNSIGEAVLQIIEDTGEERFPGQFISERKRKGQTRRFRKGMTTDNKKKLSACAKFKSLVESKRLEVTSNQLIKELKFFVSSGENTFKAKSGESDDLVMAALLCIRILDVIIGWGTETGDLREHIHDSELFEEPMPVVL